MFALEELTRDANAVLVEVVGEHRHLKVDVRHGGALVFVKGKETGSAVVVRPVELIAASRRVLPRGR